MSVLDAVTGQESAVQMLEAAIASPVPAYLLVGPAGSGVDAAGRAFAGELLASVDDPDHGERHRRLAAAGEHPDLVLIERVGPFITADQAREAVRAASTSPVEGSRKVVMLTDLHLVRDAGPMLLKAVEEPPASTIFVLLAEEIPPELVTIASRCITVEFAAIAADTIAATLIAGGIAEDRARFAADAAGGSMERARLLVDDGDAADRWAAWSRLPEVLDGTGATAAAQVDRLMALIDGASGPLDARHAREREELEVRAEQFGERGLGRSGFDDRQKRELRRLRVDELLMGFAALGASIRERIASGTWSPERGSVALGAVLSAGAALQRNPNERLLLQYLLVAVGARGGD